MARKSRQSSGSKQNYLVATSLRPNKPSRDLSLADQLIETRLRSEQAKLVLLEAELPDESDKKYTRYVDMPTPTPEDEAGFDAEFRKILSELSARTKRITGMIPKKNGRKDPTPIKLCRIGSPEWARASLICRNGKPCFI